MKVNGYNITDFVVTTYADMFHRKAVTPSVRTRDSPPAANS